MLWENIVLQRPIRQGRAPFGYAVVVRRVRRSRTRQEWLMSFSRCSSHLLEVLAVVEMRRLEYHDAQIKAKRMLDAMLHTEDNTDKNAITLHVAESLTKSAGDILMILVDIQTRNVGKEIARTQFVVRVTSHRINPAWAKSLNEETLDFGGPLLKSSGRVPDIRGVAPKDSSLDWGLSDGDS